MHCNSAVMFWQMLWWRDSQCFVTLVALIQRGSVIFSRSCGFSFIFDLTSL